MHSDCDEPIKIDAGYYMRRDQKIIEEVKEVVVTPLREKRKIKTSKKPSFRMTDLDLAFIKQKQWTEEQSPTKVVSKIRYGNNSKSNSENNSPIRVSRQGSYKEFKLMSTKKPKFPEFDDYKPVLVDQRETSKVRFERLTVEEKKMNKAM